MIIIFIELCRITDFLLWIPKSSRRTSSTFYIPNIIALLKMESQQLSQNSPNSQFDNCWDSIVDKGYNIRYTEYTRSSPQGYRNPQNGIYISTY